MSILTGRIFHQRVHDGISCDAGHAFSYEVVMGLLDLDEAITTSTTRWVAWGDKDTRWTWTRWRRADHFGNVNEPLSHVIRKLLRENLKGIEEAWEECHILLLTNLSCLGYNFNPVSIYYVLSHDRTRLVAAVLEVSNTPWLEKRLYVLDLSQTNHVSWSKDFHVSPFFDEGHTYKWTLSPPTTHGELQITATSTRREEFQAKETSWRHDHVTGSTPITLSCTRHNEMQPNTTFRVTLQLTTCKDDKAIGKAMRRHLAMPFEIMWWIHEEAFRVWWKGNTYVLPPSGSPTLTWHDLLRHLLIFLIAIKSRVLSRILSFVVDGFVK